MITVQAAEAFPREIIVLNKNMTEAAAVQLMVKTAERERDRVINEAMTRSGTRPSYRQVVDYKEGAPLESVKPDGYILFAWHYLAEVVDDTYGALLNRSPHRSGRYKKLIHMYADGVRIADAKGITGDTQEVRLVATADYARRLEVGKRRNGRPFVLPPVGPHIVEETAIVARKLWRELADIAYEYHDLTNPWIIKDKSLHRRVRGRIVDYVRYPSIVFRVRQA